MERRCLNRLRWGDFPNRALAGVGMALYQELPHPRCMVVSCSAGFIVKVLGWGWLGSASPSQPRLEGTGRGAQGCVAQ